NVLRATALNGCGGTKATCYAAALTALGASFIDPAATTAAAFQAGAYFDFSTASGDATNGLSSPLNEFTFYALQSNLSDAQLQPGGAKDQRVLDKIAAATDTQRALLGSIPIPGELKFTLYFTSGQADPSHPIPIIRNEELILLRSEANWFGGSKAQAILDLTQVRQNSGKLPATTVTAVSPDSVFVKALMYERRYSLLWEQGTRWTDARRFGRLTDIPVAVPSGNVPSDAGAPVGVRRARPDGERGHSRRLDLHAADTVRPAGETGKAMRKGARHSRPLSHAPPRRSGLRVDVGPDDARQRNLDQRHDRSDRVQSRRKQPHRRFPDRAHEADEEPQGESCDYRGLRAGAEPRPDGCIQPHETDPHHEIPHDEHPDHAVGYRRFAERLHRSGHVLLHHHAVVDEVHHVEHQTRQQPA